MRHRKRRVLEGSWLNLNSVTNPKTGHKHYEISANYYRLAKRDSWTQDLTGIRSHFDPGGNRGSKNSTKWKYSNREVAEQLITMAILKWGA